MWLRLCFVLPCGGEGPGTCWQMGALSQNSPLTAAAVSLRAMSAKDTIDSLVRKMSSSSPTPPYKGTETSLTGLACEMRYPEYNPSLEEGVDGPSCQYSGTCAGLPLGS